MAGGFGHVQLLIAEEDLEHAAAILDEQDDEVFSPEPERSPAIKAKEQGTEIRPPVEQEPKPSTPVSQGSPSDGPILRDQEPYPSAAYELEEDDNELQEKVNRRFTYTAEELASRAFRVATIGQLLIPFLAVYCFFFPALLVPLYSLWLLIRMAMLPEDVSPKAMLKVYATLAIDAVTLLGILIFYLSMMRR